MDVIWLEDKPFSLQTLEENSLLCISGPQEALTLLSSPLVFSPRTPLVMSSSDLFVTLNDSLG